MNSYSPKAGRSIRTRYIVGLLTFGGLLFGAELLLFAEQAEGNGGHVVDLAGRQRMLSQRIDKLAVGIAAGDHSDSAHRIGLDVPLAATELSSACDEFYRAHRALRHGDHVRGIRRTHNADILRELDRLRVEVLTIIESARSIAGNSTLPRSERMTEAELWRRVGSLRTASELYLPRMDMIVKTYAADFAAQQARLEAWRMGLLAALVLTLLAEAFFVFEPAVRIVRRAIDEAETRRRDAEELGEAKERFLANMSHEIRTPLTAILGYIDLAGEEDISRDERAKHLGVVRQSGEHLLDVINDILDVSKFNAGKMEVRLTPTDPSLVATDVTATLRGRAEAKGIALETLIEPSIPTHVLTDPFRLKQALLNLIGNAIKFTDRGVVSVVVRPEGQRTLAFDVSDTGLGMTPEQLEKIFDAFDQGSTGMSRPHGGTGLGLTITQHIAEALGGSVDARSTSGKGSMFTLRIDAGVMSDEIVYVDGKSDTSQKTHARGAKTPVSLRETTILIADDSEDNRRLIAHLLRRTGAHLECVKDGNEAVVRATELWNAGKPLLVLMDIQMPVMDGLEATKTLRARRIGVPIIAVTANAFAEDRQACLDAGCDDFVSKPVDRHELLEACQRWATGQRPPFAA